MTRSLTIPALPCRTLEESLPFYEALGFRRTYRQERPNPYAVVVRDDINIHLYGMDGFDPAQSYGTCIVLVEDPDALYRSFAVGLRAAYGRLPVAGIPRITRPRKRYGTVYGFSVVDPGGNWLRVSRLPAADAGDEGSDAVQDEGSTDPPTRDVAGMIDVAARLGDSHGDDAAAIKVLTSGLARYPDSPASDRVRALAYRAELAVRVGDPEMAQASIADALALASTLDADEQSRLSDELSQTAALVDPEGEAHR